MNGSMDKTNEPPMESKHEPLGNSSLTPTNELISTSDLALALVACSHDLRILGVFKALGFAPLSAHPCRQLHQQPGS